LAILESAIDTASGGFAAQAAEMQALVEMLQAKRAEAALGGPEKSRARHLKRGKLLPRERVTGIGARLRRRQCMIVATTPPSSGGTYDPYS
jgi:3-methylcrotonyl-CoA carboxylase beta subunit